MTDTEARDDPNQEENEDAQHSDSSCESDSEEELGRFTERIALMDSFRPFFGCLRSGSDAPDLNHVVSGILSGKFQEIVVLTGAGISVSAGIPDFRSPGTGLYANLQKYNLPEPEAIFALDFFRMNPYPFFRLAKELFPGRFAPTPTHHFLTLLHRKGVLRRVYTQNIDTLEIEAQLPPEKYVACHGNFHTATCIRCGHTYSQEWMESKVFESDEVVIPRCVKCRAGVVKPDITFFGENLPDRFVRCLTQDVPRCDLLLVMGTSLQVYPVAGLVDMVAPSVPRVLFNREPVHLARSFLACDASDAEEPAHVVDTGFWFKLPQNYRDVFVAGDCDDGIRGFADALGWGDDLSVMIDAYEGPKLAAAAAESAGESKDHAAAVNELAADLAERL